MVRVTVPGPDSVESPVPQAPVLALAYDRDSLRQALADAAPEPRPTAAEAALDSLFAAYRGPFTAFALASAEVSRLEDSAAGGAGPSDALVAARAERERARSRLDEVRTAIGDRVDSLRTVVRQWEDKAFENWSAEVEQFSRGPRASRSDTTDARGIARITIPAGDWWIHVTAHDPLDPNARWYWNVPVPAQGDTVELGPTNGESRPRY